MTNLRIETWNVDNSGFLGTTVKITIILNIDTVDEALISITGPYDTLKIDEVLMTKEADNVYSYQYNSDEDGDEGIYTATIQLTEEISGDDFIYVDEKTFGLRWNELND